MDDSAANRLILEELLRNWGMRPSLTPGGETGLAALRLAAAGGDPFALVLPDARMPGLDGSQVLARLRGSRNWPPPRW
ncbi:MAG: response regulator [Candidatus Handelsmanbacteria bacterium]|nr:response regulator [Candidatus Handelsmanbacteria bacterium]